MTFDAAVRKYLDDNDIRPGTSLENKVALRLHRWGILAEMQYRVGKYRLDFAWPERKIALEADGPHHWRPDVAMKDAIRDSWLRGHGWIVLHVDQMNGVLDDQLVWVARIVNSEKGTAR